MKYYIILLFLLVGCKEQPPQQEVAQCPQECEISIKGLTLIRHFEGFVPYIYSDSAGFKTVGYGHLVKKGEVFTYLSPEQAQELLKNDVKEAEKAVKRFVTVPITQGQYDALTSFVFNLGASRFKSSTLLKKLNAGEIEEVPSQFARWVYADNQILDGLVKRRAKEADLFQGIIDDIFIAG